jgi:hypothetical protein
MPRMSYYCLLGSVVGYLLRTVLLPDETKRIAENTQQGFGNIKLSQRQNLLIN